MRERSRSLPMKVQQALMWQPEDAHPGQQQQPVAASLHNTGSDDVQRASGYINICGIALPCKRLVGSAQAVHRLIHTAAVADSLKAAALALCQNRPLLLEGPPG